LDEKLSNVEFLVVVNIMRWQKTSGLANQSSPTLTTPKCINILKNYHQSIFFAFVRERTPLYSKEQMCSMGINFA